MYSLDAVKRRCLDAIELCFDKRKRPVKFKVCELSRLQFPAKQRDRAGDLQPVRYVYMNILNLDDSSAWFTS